MGLVGGARVCLCVGEGTAQGFSCVGGEGDLSCAVLLHLPSLGFWPRWRNWQTRQTQNLLSERACGFDSHPRHQGVYEA